MANNTPEKFVTRAEIGKVKETTPDATPLVEAVSSLVNMIQKINDLGDASKALSKAGELFNQGDTEKARDLAFKVFDRLKQVGKVPEKLNLSRIQSTIDDGKYKDLVKEINSVRESGDAKDQTSSEDLLKRLENDTSKNYPDKKDKKIELDTLKDEMFGEVQTKESEIVGRERQLQQELSELLSKIESKENDSNNIQQIQAKKLIIEAGLIGQVDVPKQLEMLKDKIKENRIRFERKGEKANLSEWGNVAGKMLTGRPLEAMQGVAEIVKKSSKGEQVFISRLYNLTTGMEEIKKGTAKGLSIQDAVRKLNDTQIREVRSMLSSMDKIEDEAMRPPYYDEKYVEFTKALNLDKVEASGLFKVLEAVDVNYQRAELNRPSPNLNQNGESRSKPRHRAGEPQINDMRMADEGLVMDEAGNPTRATAGIDSLGLNEEGLDAMKQSGKTHFDDLYEDLGDGKRRERTMQEQLEIQMDRAQKLGRNEQRESFLNINMQELFVHMQKTRPDLYAMIDMDFYAEHQVAKLKNDVLSNAKEKKAFEDWWYQEVSFNQRGLAYEGLFERRNQSPRMQRLNSLMEIIGVATDKKGLANWMSMSYGTIDQQNNSYVNAEFMGKLATFWTNQGVDFRLEDMLKQYREEICVVNKEGERGEKIGTISVFDAVSFMQKDIPQNSELRKKLGIPEWWEGKFGTMIYKYSEGETRGKARRAIWDHFMQEELGIDLSKMDTAQADAISNKYQLMFDLGFQYSVVHKQLHMMLGNASFKKGELELPGAAAEMHLKMDPLLYPKLFAPRFQFLNVAFMEAWALYDPGVRDYVTMATQDYASHFTETGFIETVEKLANGRERVTVSIDLDTDNGSPSILSTFFDDKENSIFRNSEGLKERRIELDSFERDKPKKYKDAAEAKAAKDKLIDDNIGKFSPEVQKRIQAARKLEKIFKDSIWHWGTKPHGDHTTVIGTYMELGSHGDMKSAFRHSAGKVTENLLAARPDKEILDLMNWDKYCDIVKDPRMKERIDATSDVNEKWRIFAETFGEQSFNHSTPSAKRSGDHPVKYGVEQFNKYTEAFLAWAEDPFNQEKFDALLAVPTSVNAAVIPKMSAKNLRFLLAMSERMGRRELGGSEMQRFKRDPATKTIKVDTSKGNEWPSIELETIKNNRWFWDPIQHKSIPESVGVGVPVDKQILLDLIRGQRAKGRLPDDVYSKFYKTITNSVLWEKDLGTVVNLYKWITLETPLEWLAPMMGITGHELKHILSENTEKTAEKFLHYVNGKGH